MIVSRFKFTEDLVLRRKLAGDGKLFYVDKPYKVTFYLDDMAKSVTVLPGFSTDLASVPQIVPRWIAEKIDGRLEAAVIHDYLYRTHMFPRNTTDKIYLAAMKAAGKGGIISYLMYQAVNWFGWKAYG